MLLTAAAALAIVQPAAAQLSPTSRAGAVVTTEHVRAELVAYAPDGVVPGQPVWLGLSITHQPDWHTYWKNAGDSGLPTELAWQLPAGLTTGDIAWPVPKKIPIGHLANYGYEGTVLLPVPVTVASSFKPAADLTGETSSIDVRLKASWLVCRKECIPEEGEFALKLPVRGSTALHKSDFDAALAAQPAELSAKAGTVAVDGNAIKVRLDGLPAAARGKSLEFFPETGDVIHTAAVSGKDWTQAWDGDSWTATVPLAEQRSASPTIMPLVVALAPTDRQPGQPIAWRAEAPVSGAWPTLPAKAQVTPELKAALEANAASAKGIAPPVPSQQPAGSLVMALFAALLGGILLNLMPCVFPVLAIKVLGFAKQAGDHTGHRRAGLAYTAGVMLSFLALGGAMLALRAAGAQMGWGFQLQSPVVVAVLAGLFTLIGLNLFGVFEVRMMAPSSICTAQVRHPVANNFLTGVLAVVIASPCTAPFMGASMGVAIGLPAAQALLLFAALGLGMALPYLTAAFIPAVAHLLPKPGAWMQTLRKLLAFPMFATVAWLVWVLGQQSGIDGAGALLALLVAGSAVVWAFTLRGRTRTVLATILLAGFAVLVGSLGRNITQPPAAEPMASRQGERWEPWSVERVAALNAEGRPVFVDYTAAWCVTCQFNKRVLDDAGVLADFQGKKVALLRADWTRRDPDITRALTALGRSGVPVYVLHAPGKSPLVMTEILGKDDVRRAVSAL